jgi:hypothetical protein
MADEYKRPYQGLLHDDPYPQEGINWRGLLTGFADIPRGLLSQFSDAIHNPHSQPVLSQEQLNRIDQGDAQGVAAELRAAKPDIIRRGLSALPVVGPLIGAGASIGDQASADTPFDRARSFANTFGTLAMAATPAKKTKYDPMIPRKEFPRELVKEAKDYGHTPMTVAEEQEALNTPQAKQQVKDVREAVRAGDRSLFPDLANRYPEVGPPVIRADVNTGKPYLSKSTTPEAQAVGTARAEIDKQIKAGNYDPLFPVSQRFDARGNYGTWGDTALVRPKKPEIIAKWEDVANDPAALERLMAAWRRGQVTMDQSGNWYHVGQLEEGFLKDFGPTQGPAQFKNVFSTPMAATTSGSTPNANLLTSGFGNFLRGQGLVMPDKSWLTPTPVGGARLLHNMKTYNEILNEGGGNIDMYKHPKPFDFDTAFQGNPNAAVMDEQMTKGGWPNTPGVTGMPPWYGPFTVATRNLAHTVGEEPRNFQGKGWAGFKEYPGKPMIQDVNEVAERTSRVTGQTPDRVMEQYRRMKTPLYGIGAATLLGIPGLLDQTDDSGRPPLTPDNFAEDMRRRRAGLLTGSY